jgi:hypothetical protein
LHVDDELGLLKATAQTGIFRLQALVLLGQRVEGRLAAALLGRQGLQLAFLALTAPGGQMGRVEAFAAQQGADGTLVAAGLGLLDDGALVLGGELPAFRFGRDFRVRNRDRRGAAGVGSSFAAGGLATLALPPLRSCRLRLCGFQLLEIRLEH